MILVVDLFELFLKGLFRPGLVILKVFPKLLIIGNACVKRFP
jgi:hypothetical protein